MVRICPETGNTAFAEGTQTVGPARCSECGETILKSEQSDSTTDTYREHTVPSPKEHSSVRVEHYEEQTSVSVPERKRMNDAAELLAGHHQETVAEFLHEVAGEETIHTLRTEQD